MRGDTILKVIWFRMQDVVVSLSFVAIAIALLWIAISLHVLASPPEGTQDANALLSVGYTIVDPEGYEVEWFEE